MARPLLTDELWEVLEPLIPPARPRRKRYPGRKPLEPRRVLTGILFVLKFGIPWEALPVEMGCGSGMTCLNYLRSWKQAGAWSKLHEALVRHLPGADRFDWSRIEDDQDTERAGPAPTVRPPPRMTDGPWPMALPVAMS